MHRQSEIYKTQTSAKVESVTLISLEGIQRHAKLRYSADHCLSSSSLRSNLLRSDTCILHDMRRAVVLLSKNIGSACLKYGVQKQLHYYHWNFLEQVGSHISLKSLNFTPTAILWMQELNSLETLVRDGSNKSVVHLLEEDDIGERSSIQVLHANP